MARIKTFLIFFQIIYLTFIIFGWGTCVFAFPFKFKDSAGHDISIIKEPVRVASLVPGITEIILKIGAVDSLKGITYHSAGMPGTSGMEIMGGFFSPDLDRIEAIEPDLVFYSSLQGKVRERFAGCGLQLINFDPSSLQESFNHIILIGKIFGRLKKAEAIVAGIKGELDLIRKKVERIPTDRRKKVIRIMGVNKDTLMTPGMIHSRMR